MLKDGGTSTVTEADVGIAPSNREPEKYCKNTVRTGSQNCSDSSFVGLQH